MAVVLHPFEQQWWKQLFIHEEECVIHQVKHPDVNVIVFYAYLSTENTTKYTDTVAVFKVKRKLTNMAIADNIINNDLKNFAR